MLESIKASPKFHPVLDPEFVPACLWNRAYRVIVRDCGVGQDLALALRRSDGSVSVHKTKVLPHEGGNVALNRALCREAPEVPVVAEGRVSHHRRRRRRGLPLISAPFMHLTEHARSITRSWGNASTVSRCGSIARSLKTPPPNGKRRRRWAATWTGIRIGFDLGASDRKCAAVVNGEVVFSEEAPWNPSDQADPQYHFDGINDSLKRAAGEAAARGRHWRQRGGRLRQQ